LRKLSLALAALVTLASPAFAQEGTDPKKPEAKKDAVEAAIQKRLDTQKLNLNLDETPFPEVVQVLHELTEVDFVIDTYARDIVDEEGIKISMKERDTLLKDTMDKVLKKASSNLTYEVWKGTIWITTKAGVARKPEAATVDAATAKKLETKVTLSVEGESLADVFAKLKTQGNVAFSAAKEIDTKGVKVTLDVKDAKLSDVIDMLCRLLSFTAEAKDGAVVLSPPKAK
jgi:hypothetical protein